MTHEDLLEQYSRLRLGGRELPADLRTLIVMRWQPGVAPVSADPLGAMGVTLLEAGESHDLLDHSYLNDEDRANPDVMANVAAMKTTCELAAFVARDHDGSLFGYWIGPENVDIGSAPVLKVNSEGEFSLLEGRTLSEALLGNHAFEDAEKFAGLKASFATAGIAIGADSWDQLPYPKPPTDPALFHHQCYEENLGKGGNA